MQKKFQTTEDARFHNANRAEIEATVYIETTEDVTNFANALATNREAFNTLTTTNAQLQQQIAILAKQNIILQEMMCLSITNNNNNFPPPPPPNPHLVVLPPTTQSPFQQWFPPAISPFKRGQGLDCKRGHQVRFGP